MRESRKGTLRIIGRVTLVAVMLVTALSACQSAPTTSPTPATIAPATAAPAAPAPAPTAAPAAAAPTAAAVPKTVTVKIGHMPALTGSMASTGEPAGKGAADYFQSLNDQGGIAYKDPKTGAEMRAKLEVAQDDTGYEATRALGVYQRQKAAGVVAILSHGGIIANALAEPASKDKIAVVVNSSPSSVSLAPKPRHLITSYAPGGPSTMAFIKYVTSQWKESRKPRLGLTVFDNPSALVYLEGVDEYAKSLGWEVLPREALPLPLTDASIQMKRLFAGKPDWIFNALNAQGLATVMRDAARLGFQGQAKWATVSGAWDPETYRKVADAETDGAMAWVYTASLTDQNVPAVKLTDAISRKYQNAPLTSVNYFQQIGFAQVMIAGVKGALEKVGAEALTGEAVRNALFTLKDIDTGGLLSPVTMTEDSPWMFTKARLIQWKDRKEVFVSDWQEGFIK